MIDFFDRLKQSVYGPSFYRDLLERPFSYSMRYYLELALLVSVLLTIVLSIPLVPRVDRFLGELPDAIMRSYPDGLVIEVTDGVARANVVEPYFVPIPSFSSSSARSSTTISLLVIDTTSEVTRARFEEYASALWLSRDAIYTIDRRGEPRPISLAGVTMRLDASALRSALAEMRPYFALVNPLVVLAIFFGMLATFAAMLAYLLIDALFVLGLGRIIGRKWSYGESYRIALHAITLPLLLSSLFLLFPIGGVDLPFFAVFLLLLTVYFNFRTEPEERIPELDREG